MSFFFSRTKHFFDQYQMTLGVDLWNSHYEVLFSLSSLSLFFLQIYFFQLIFFLLLLRQNMQENLKKLKEVNKNLRKEIRYNFLAQCFSSGSAHVLYVYLLMA